MRLGIGSYAFGWAVGVAGQEPPQPMDEHALLDLAIEWGLTRVQFGDNMPLIDWDTARLERLGARAARAGVTVELGARGLTPSNVAAHLALARRLRAPLVRFVIDGPEYRPELAEATDVLRRAALGLTDGPLIALENHDRFPAKTLRSVVESIGSEKIGICLDTANSLGAGEGLGEVLAILAPYTINLHVKDFAVTRLPHQMGFSVEGRPAGAGLMELPNVLTALAPHGRCQSVILELWTPPESSLTATIAKERAWAAQSITYLKPFFPA